MNQWAQIATKIPSMPPANSYFLALSLAHTVRIIWPLEKEPRKKPSEDWKLSCTIYLVREFYGSFHLNYNLKGYVCINSLSCRKVLRQIGVF